MRNFLMSVAVIGLIGGAGLAMAQDRDHGGRGGAPRAESPRDHSGPAMSGPRPQEHRDAPAMRANDNDNRRGDAMRGPAPNNNAMRGPAPDNNARRGPDNGPRPEFNRRDGRPDNAVRGPRRDFSGVRNYHRNFRAERRFRMPTYRRPPGWYARRWTWGEFLPNFFWTSNYWIIDFSFYGLPPPPFGAIWVRVGDDALLIDRFNGEIIEVAYGIFY
jgi:Ni/Co efflux regulator RcnB